MVDELVDSDELWHRIDWLIREGYKWFPESASDDAVAAVKPEKSGATQIAGVRRSSPRLEDWQLAAIKQQLALRWRSRRRFPEPGLWWWTERSLAQASDWSSAQYKAAIFPDQVSVVDGCCGAGVDLVALAGRGPVVGIDSNPICLRLAEANLRSHELSSQLQLGQLPRDLPSQTQWLHLDPDRRQGQQRTQRAALFTPTLVQSHEMMQRVRGGMVKLAPSTSLDSLLTEPQASQLLRLWLGNQGECRQQLLLYGDLIDHVEQQIASIESLAGGRAAVLCEPGREPSFFAVSQPSMLAESEFNDLPIFEETELERYVFDLHATLHAADLHKAWAAQAGLKAVGGSHGYFTGSQPLDSCWAQCFEVLDVLAWDDRKLRKWLRSRKIGQVEVKVRQTKLDANAAQRHYSASGDPQRTEACTLLVTRFGRRVRAIAAKRRF